MARFPHLFSPFQLRGQTVKNRLFFPPHGTSLVENGKVGDRLVAYHEARARGGVGLISISQFTLAADGRKGRRPSFDRAEAPDRAQPLVDRFRDHLRGLGFSRHRPTS